MEFYTYTEVVSHRCIAYTLMFSHVDALSETRILYMFLYTHIIHLYTYIILYIYIYMCIYLIVASWSCASYRHPPNHIAMFTWQHKLE